MLNFVADVVSLATLYTAAYTLYQKNHLIPSVMHEEGFASIMEHCGAYAPLLHALVEYHIPTTLPMKQLHAGTGAVQENIHTSIGRTKGVTANKNAEGIHAFTKVNGAREQQESVTFI